MRLMNFLSLSLALLGMMLAGAASSQTLWYDGDADLVNGTVNGRGYAVPVAAFIYEDFTVPAGQSWTITGAFSNNYMTTNTTLTGADYEIRQGVSQGVAGTVLFSVTNLAATATATGRSAFGYTEYSVSTNFTTSVVLGAGTYFIGVRPVTTAGTGNVFVSTTSGTNGVGAPLNNDNAYFNDTAGQFGLPAFDHAGDGTGVFYDYSIGIRGNSAAAPTIVANPNNLALGSTPAGTPSTPVQSYVVSGTNLTADITITPPTGVEIRNATAAGSFTSSAITVTRSGTSVPNTTIEVRISAAATVGQSFNPVTNASTGATTQNVTLTGTVTTPTPAIIVTPNNLALGTTTAGTPSTPAQSYVISGSNLTSNITITPPSGVEIRNVTAGGTFASTALTLTQTGGTVSNTTIEVRIAASATVGQTFNPITNVAGTASQNVTLTGTVNTPPPQITCTPGNLALGITTAGTPSTPSQPYVVSGVNLLTDIVITPPAGVEIRTGAGSFATTPITLTQTGGTVANTTIDVRIGAGATSGQIFNPITNVAGTASQNVTLTGTVTTPVPNMAVTRGATAVADGGAPDALGSIPAGIAQTVTYTITNNGTAGLNLTGGATLVAIGTLVNVTSATITTPPAVTSLAPAASTTFVITYMVTTAAGFSFDVSIANNDPGTNKNPYNWTTSGTGSTSPSIAVTRGATPIADAGADAVGNAAFGAAKTFTYTITNSGTAALTLTLPVSISGLTNCAASVTTPPAASVGVGLTTTMIVSVTPTAAGAFSFVVSVTNDDPGINKNPYSWTVNGTGTTLGTTGKGKSSGGGGCSTDGAQAPWFAVFGVLAALVAVGRLRRARQ